MSVPPTNDDAGGKAAKPPAAKADFSSPPIHPPYQQPFPLGSGQTLIQVSEERRSGPLPDSREFQSYKEADPRAPGLILEMAERQQKHDIWMDKATLISETFYRTLGILAATGIVGGMISGSVICAINGQTAPAVALGAASGLAAVAGVFIRGRNLMHMQAQPEATTRPKPQPDRA